DDVTALGSHGDCNGIGQLVDAAEHLAARVSAKAHVLRVAPLAARRRGSRGANRDGPANMTLNGGHRTQHFACCPPSHRCAPCLTLDSREVAPPAAPERTTRRPAAEPLARRRVWPHRPAHGRATRGAIPASWRRRRRGAT